MFVIIMFMKITLSFIFIIIYFISRLFLAQVVGALADKAAGSGKTIQGLLVQQNRNDMVIDPDDLPAFTRLQRGGILQRQAVPLRGTFSEVGR